MADRFGVFDVGKELGRGSFGVVHDAVHRETGRRVALKRLLLPGPDGKRLQRFERGGRGVWL